MKSVPYVLGKKPPTATKVASKTQPSAAADKASTSDADYEPPEGGDSDVESDTEDVINPLIDQELYIYDYYMVDITDERYNTKTSIKTCPTKTNAIVVSNFPLQRNSKHMRNNMPDRCGHVSSVIR